MARLDPELRYLLEQYTAYQADPGKSIDLVSVDEPIRVLLTYTGDIDLLIPLGLQIDSYLEGGKVSGRLLLANLEALARHAAVLRINKSKSYRPTLDGSVPEIRAGSVRTVNAGTFSGATGKGVIVGIIDTGIDYRHKAFRLGNTSRILRIWDQSVSMAAEPATGKQTPQLPSSISTIRGVEYLQAKINDALAAANPLSIVGQMDIDGHGTHVAGIAAGNGAQSGGCHGAFHYVGVAPEADLIVVKLDHFGRQPDDTISGAVDADILDAVRYIIHHAELLTKRVAINMSLGGQRGSHDGKDDLEIDLSLLQLLQDDVVSIVIAAGNEGADQLHAQADVPANGSLDLELSITTDSDKPKTEIIEIWYNAGQTLSCSVQPDGGSFTSPAISPPNAQTFSAINNGGSVRIDGGPGIGASPDNCFTIFLIPPATGKNKSGDWKIRLTNASATAVPIHAWLPTHGSTGSTFDNHLSSRCTIGNPGSAQEVITVGSYRLGTFFGLFDGNISEFSSRGPVRNNLYHKPEITTPGEAVTAPGIAGDRNDFEDYLCFECCCDCCADFYVDKQGTSMAAPHVAGAIALLLQKKATLRHGEIRTLLTDKARHDSDTGATPNADWGFGKMDVAAMLNAIVMPTPTPPAPVPNPTPMVALPHHRQLIDLRERFLHTSRGAELSMAFRAFAKEILGLINTNKRVATVWHRMGGPAWVRVAFQVAATPTMPIPGDVNGLPLLDGIARMLAILKQYGSAAFVQTLTQYEPELTHIQPGMSLLQLIDRLGEPMPTV